MNVAQDPEELTEAQVLRIKQETEFMGAVRVFHWTYAPSGSVVGGHWSEKGTQLAGLSTADLTDDPNGDIYKHAGKSVSLSHDGNVLAYGVSTEEVADAESLSAVRIFEWLPQSLDDCADEPTDEEHDHCWIPRGRPIVGAGTAGTMMSMSKRGDTIAFGGMGMVKVYVHSARGLGRHEGACEHGRGGEEARHPAQLEPLGAQAQEDGVPEQAAHGGERRRREHRLVVAAGRDARRVRQAARQRERVRGGRRRLQALLDLSERGRQDAGLRDTIRGGAGGAAGRREGLHRGQDPPLER